ncbi:MAG: bifunctional 4-hydroxy-2-oxoglutarate aldolase/2-dehydro-3-deoxy-phosphogluconate aldolase [Solirubrobacteraceae bacterium]
MVTSVTDVLAAVLERRLVPVVVLQDAAAAPPLADALVAGGLPVAEVTFRTPAAEAALRALASRTDVLAGAGTVLTPDQVDRAADAGARFVVSPGVSAAVVQRGQELGLAVLPGVATASEVMKALDLGIDVVKFFPAETSGGPAAVKALAAPFPGLRFVPTGGIGAAQLPGYLGIPAVAAVGGSWMVAPSLVAAHDFDEITRRTAAAVAAVAAAR